MADRTIDYSRYRVVQAIWDLWEAGEPTEDIADDYFGETYDNTDLRPLSLWVVELIVAAHDRKGKYEPKVSAV